MKISKLFHWLYALVMLLPIFAVGVTCGYVLLNKNAYKSFDTSAQIESTTSITNYSEFILDENYLFQTRKEYTSTNVISRQYYFDSTTFDFVGNGFTEQDYVAFRLVDLGNQDGIYMWAYYNDSQYENKFIGLPSFYVELTNIEGNQTSLLADITFITYKTLKLNDTFYYSIDKLKENNLFSWSYNSFLGQPILFITNLFGIPSNHIIIYLLSYWLAISIIWLVFDLIMYVPLLVHRWLDKGVLE